MSAHPVSTDAPIDAHLAAALGGRPTIGLEEIDAVAALQTRHDRKYLLAADRLDDVLAAVAVPMRVLRIDDRIASPYRSTYFDTPDRFSYRQAARSRPARFKVRTRTYVATGSCWLEVKGRTARGHTVKERIAHPPDAEAVLTPEALAFLRGYPDIAPYVEHLTPRIVTTYRRATIEAGQRATIDAGLRAALPDGRPIPLGDLDRVLVVETKSCGPGPGPVDRALWRSGVRPSTISKYAVATAASEAGLAANKWHRVLRRHGVRPASPAGDDRLPPTPSVVSEVGS